MKTHLTIVPNYPTCLTKCSSKNRSNYNIVSAGSYDYPTPAVHQGLVLK